jgi:hypothetical protein
VEEKERKRVIIVVSCSNEEENKVLGIRRYGLGHSMT